MSSTCSIAVGIQPMLPSTTTNGMCGKRSHAPLNRTRKLASIEFTPASSKFANQPCSGVNIAITDRARFEPLKTGFTVAAALRKLHPTDWETKSYDRLLGNAAVLQAVNDGKSADDILEVARTGVNDFLRRRQKYLIYE